MFYLNAFISLTLSTAFILMQCDAYPSENIEEINKEIEASDPPGFYVDGRFLYDKCGNRVILRGVNKMVIVRDIDGEPSFTEIAKTGANAVRIMWGMWKQPSEIEQSIVNAKKNDLIPIIELHDATGKWEKLDEVIAYWTRPEMVSIIKKYQDYLLVNIANEAGDHSVTDQQYKEGYQNAIRQMRKAGIKTPLIIDAAGWGRNEKQLLRLAPWLQDQDPDQNLIFSWHLWDAGPQKERITKTLEQSVEMELPFIVGEFGNTDVGCKGEIDYLHLIKEAERLDIGWLAWSWGPGNGNCAEMDMTEDGTFETLHDWGLEVAITDEYSIQNTAEYPIFLSGEGCPDE
jgi:mannan endo-1,4-beta-mannosidase